MPSSKKNRRMKKHTETEAKVMKKFYVENNDGKRLKKDLVEENESDDEVNTKSTMEYSVMNKKNPNLKGCYYAYISKALGNRRFNAVIVDSSDPKMNKHQLIVRAPRRFNRHNAYIGIGTIVLVNPWDFQTNVDKGDIVMVYDSNQQTLLMREISKDDYYELTKINNENDKKEEHQEEGMGDVGFVFDTEDDFNDNGEEIDITEI